MNRPVELKSLSSDGPVRARADARRGWHVLRVASSVVLGSAVCLAIFAGHAGRALAGVAPSAPAAHPSPAVPVTAVSLQSRFDTQVKPLLQQHCFRCHGNGKHKGDLTLDRFNTWQSVQQDRKTWQHLADVLNQRVMPPEERPQPKPEEYATLVNWIDAAINYYDPAAPRDPGRVAIHRLNRTEYTNTLRDLLGVAPGGDFQPARDFPNDDTGYGFDNIADVLTMSPLLAEKYLAAAEAALDKALVFDNPYAEKTKRREDLTAEGDSSNVGGTLMRNGETFVQHIFVCDGEYEIRLQASQDPLGKDPAKMVLKIDGKEAKTFDVYNFHPRGKSYTYRTRLTGGRHRIAAAYTNNQVDKDNPDRRKRGDRNLYVDWIEFDGPFNVPPPPPSAAYKNIFCAAPGNGVSEDEAARKIIERFTTRAYRRPATGDEVAALLRLFKGSRADGDKFEQAVKYTLSAVLCSPHFLYRIELDPKDAAPGTVHRLTDYELATRLSYFLWGSMPDDLLITLAGTNQLHEPSVLEGQVKRMLLDPKAKSLVTDFAGQWLELRVLDDCRPDTKRYPNFTEKLRQDMRRETQMFVQNLIRSDGSVLDLLGADYTFANERLARLYGLKGVKGEEFKKVSLAGTHRGGVLTQASVLMVTAMPARTSPVKRGKFILEQILGTPPPPPPPDVPSLNEKNTESGAQTVRQRLEAHRANPNCAVCHQRLDPLGFALENFDPIGGWRDKDGSAVIDASGQLPDGTDVTGPDRLRQVLLQHKDDFVRCLSEKMLTYALGRGMEYYDQATVHDIVQNVQKNGYRFSSMVLGIATSDAFQKRRTPTLAELKQAEEQKKANPAPTDKPARGKV